MLYLLCWTHSTAEFTFSTVFDEEDDESGNSLKPPGDVSRTRTASGRKVPAGAVSMFGTTGGGNPLASALSKRRVSSSSVSISLY